MSAAQWTQADKDQAIESYLEEMEKYETEEEKGAVTIEVVNGIAEVMGKTVNGVRIQLMKANVYVKKLAEKAVAKEGKAVRVSKADAQAELTTVIASICGVEVDAELIAKLTGKAAQYFAGVIATAQTA